MWKMTKSNYYEVIDGTTMYHEDYVKRLQEENEELKKHKMTPDELVSLLNQALIKENNNLNNILTEFEHYLKEEIKKLDEKINMYYEKWIGRDCREREYVLNTYMDILKKLQELKEGKK